MLDSIAVVAASSALVFGCHSSRSGDTQSNSSTTETQVAISSVPEVAHLLQSKGAVVLDANGEGTRREYGTVPGAVLLSNYDHYALSELPANKSDKLVFYCGGTMCRASDTAASRALAAGYSNVSVMRDGIKGWKSAGQPTESPKS